MSNGYPTICNNVHSQSDIIGSPVPLPVTSIHWARLGVQVGVMRKMENEIIRRSRGVPLGAISAWLLCAAAAAGQTAITWDFAGGLTPPSGMPLADTPTWLGRLQPIGPEDAGVKTVLGMSERAAKMAVSLAPSRLLGALTSTVNGGDALFAAWSLDNTSGPRQLAVWDTPRQTAFLLIWNRIPFTNSDEAGAFMKHIVPSSGPFANLHLHTHWDAQAHKFEGYGSNPSIIEPRGNEVQVFGVPVQDNSYVYALVAGKRLVEQAFYTGDPSDFIFVPERFPPLRERIGSWTKERVTAELSDGNDDFARNRDEILLQEVLSRRLTAADLQQLFAAPGPFRVEYVMQALLASKRVSEYGSGLRDILLAQNPGIHHSEEIVRVMLRTLGSSADVDLRDAVSRFLASGIFAPWTFTYMERRGRTQQDYGAVERAVLPAGVDGVEAYRARALAQIRRRIAGQKP